MNRPHVIEQELGIGGDYQYKALNSRNFLQAHWHANKLETLRRLIQPSTTLLDLGTGSGNLELVFSPLCSSITGVDYNEDALHFLRSMIKTRKIRNVTLVRADIRSLPHTLFKKKYSLVTLIDVIEHITMEDALRFAKTLGGGLKKGAVVCIITPNYSSPWRLIEHILDAQGLVPKLDKHQHLAKYNPHNLPQLMDEAGFSCQSLRTFNLFSYLSPSRSMAKKLCEWELESRIPWGNLLWGVFVKR